MIIYKFQKLEQLPFTSILVIGVIVDKGTCIRNEENRSYFYKVLLHKLIVSIVGQDIVGVDAAVVAVVVVKVELQTEIRTGNSSPGMNLNRLPLEAKKMKPGLNYGHSCSFRTQ